ncbi:hypothetical protein, partial [Tabrizicola sp.]|uniref:hypothetical protein n=1 Tax=Tabrizicola sp. TaxID=2005166 RepID=UPI001A378902
MILKLAAALMTALAICLSAPAHADAKSSAPLAAQDVSAYDGTYILEVGRVWRDVYWIDKGNEHYVPGRVDPLARALVRAQGGRLELVEAIEFEKSDGPVFQGFVGSFLDEGVLRFSADVNYLVGKPAPYALTVDFPLSDAIIAGEKAQVEPDGFDAAYRAHVTLQKITGAATPPALPQGQGGDALAENDVLLETAPLLQLPLAQLEAVKKALSLVRWNAESQRMQEWRECPPDALAPLRVLAVFVLKKPSGMSLAECYVRGSNMTLHYSVGPVFSSLGIDLQQQLISVHRSRQGQPFRASQTHSCVDIKDGSVFQSAQHEDGYFTCLPLDSAGRLARAVGGESEGSVGIDKGRLAAEQAERERLATEEVQLQDDPSVGDSAPVSPLSSDLDAILANCRMDYCSWVSVTKRS